VMGSVLRSQQKKVMEVRWQYAMGRVNILKRFID